MPNQTKSHPAQPEISSFRKHLEQQIVASMGFFPSSALEACSILNASNFRHRLSGIFFKVIRSCVDRGEVDTTHYLKEFHLHHPKENSSDVLHYMDDHLIDDKVREKCLILIELDMRDKFGTALKQNELVAVANQDFEKATVWKNAFDFIQNPRKDIFQAIPELRQYLKTYVSDEELEEWTKMEAAIPGMVERVRGQERSRRFIETLTSLACSGDMESHRRESVEILKDLLIQCISRLPIPPTLNHQLTDLKRNLWQAPTPSQESNSF